jgi:hypothetical protein
MIHLGLQRGDIYSDATEEWTEKQEKATATATAIDELQLDDDVGGNGDLPLESGTSDRTGTQQSGPLDN